MTAAAEISQQCSVLLLLSYRYSYAACSMMATAASLHPRPLLIQKKYAHFSAAAAAAAVVYT
jgi:hypothetical protein